MHRLAVICAAAFATTLASAPAMAAEVVSVSFTTPTGGQSVGTYSGVVNLTVSGTGFSLGPRINDAFYDVLTQTRDPSYYQLTFGTAPLVPFNPAQNAVNFLVGPLPAYSPTNTYSFQLNTGLVTPGILYFGVSDGNFGDNGGAYRIVINAVPEPASWALLIAGFGALGTAVRQERRSVRVA